MANFGIIERMEKNLGKEHDFRVADIEARGATTNLGKSAAHSGYAST